jgi:MOSC domain-containing protein YiiM
LGVETCNQCGFDAGDWNVRDAGSLFDALGEWWGPAVSPFRAEVLNERPGPLVWSPLEYGLHSIFAIRILRERIEWMLEGAAPGEAPPPWPPLPAAEELVLELPAAEIVAHLEEQGKLTHALTTRKDITWTPEAEAMLFHAVHDTSHHMMDVSRLLAPYRPASVGGASVGRVAQINVSGGGVPKRPVEAVMVGRRGLAGDRQGNRKHHGRPFQAVCLWSTEVIGELAADGHPIHPGAAGENFTVSGLDWPALRPGTILRFEAAGEGGDGATPLEVELSWPAPPCRHQMQWFSDGDYNRIDHDRNPGFSRWYAWVRRPGPVAAGDRVVVPFGP